MTQQNINIGTVPNDGTGDNLRSGMTKVNSNFTDLYATSNNLNNGTAPDAGTLTGAEIAPLSRGAGLLQTTLQKLAAWILTLICPSVATFAALPTTPTGFYLVLADETKSGNPTIYFFTATHRYWIAMVQDA